MGVKDDQSLNHTFSMRVNDIQNEKFAKKCVKLGKSPAHFLRECMKAFNEDRLKIQLTPTEIRNLKEVHDVN